MRSEARRRASLRQRRGPRSRVGLTSSAVFRPGGAQGLIQRRGGEGAAAVAQGLRDRAVGLLADARLLAAEQVLQHALEVVVEARRTQRIAGLLRLEELELPQRQ